MIKKILVPIAFSNYSKEIIQFASELAKPSNAQLLIANVVDQRDLEAVERIAGHGYKVDGDRYISIIQEERINRLEKILEEIGLDESGYTFFFRAGEPTGELLRLVVEEEVDLVVMGNKVKEIRHIFTGSVAERMFRRCPVPIVSYRGEESAKALRKRIKKELAK